MTALSRIARTPVPGDVKAKVLDDYRHHVPSRLIAEKHGISKATVLRIVKPFREALLDEQRRKGFFRFEDEALRDAAKNAAPPLRVLAPKAPKVSGTVFVPRPEALGDATKNVAPLPKAFISCPGQEVRDLFLGSRPTTQGDAAKNAAPARKPSARKYECSQCAGEFQHLTFGMCRRCDEQING